MTSGEEPSEEPGYILVAVLIGAVLGTLTVACAARRSRQKERGLSGLSPPDSVEPTEQPASDDVSLSLDGRE